MTWMSYAAISALFAGLTALLAKIGVENVPSNLATLIRTIVIVVFASGIVLARGELSSLGQLSLKSWTFLVFSGIATGLSWLFYFAALKLGPISGVAPIDKLSFLVAMTLGFLILREPIKPLTLAGAALIATGVLITIPSIQEMLVGLGKPPTQ